MTGVSGVNLPDTPEGLKKNTIFDIAKLAVKHNINSFSPMSNKYQKEKQYFEANLLDGDKIEDCGGAMLSAKEVWQLVEELLEKREEHLNKAFTYLVKYDIKKEYFYNERTRKDKEATHHFMNGTNAMLTVFQNYIDSISHSKEELPVIKHKKLIDLESMWQFIEGLLEKRDKKVIGLEGDIYYLIGSLRGCGFPNEKMEKKYEIEFSQPKEEQLPTIKHKKLIDPVGMEKLAKKVRKSFVEEQKYLDKLEFERRLENLK